MSFKLLFSLIKDKHLIYSALILFALCVTSNAGTITVSKTYDSDYKSIQEAIKAASSGDIIDVGPGIYNESLIINTSITIKGAGPNFSIINSTYNMANTSQNTIQIVNESIRVHLQGIAIISNKDGILSDKNYVTVTVKNCIITGGDNGIKVKGLSCSISLINNTIINNRLSGIDGTDGHPSYPTSFLIIGNIIAYNSIGINLKTSHSRTLNYNNLYQNTTTHYSTNIGKGPNSISKNPLFVDQQSGNYVLAFDSPCINTGAEGLAYQDPDGSINDIGAYAGPDAITFWPYPVDGPVVSNFIISPTSVAKGEKIKIRVEGRIR